jgi:hypothetical protein
MEDWQTIASNGRDHADEALGFALAAGPDIRHASSQVGVFERTDRPSMRIQSAQRACALKPEAHLELRANA